MTYPSAVGTHLTGAEISSVCRDDCDPMETNTLSNLIAVYI